MTIGNVGVERDGAVGILSIRRPDKLNALNDATLRELAAAVDTLTPDRSVRCLVVTGGEAKKPAFVAGADIGELAEQTPLEAEARSRLGQDAFDRLERFGRPVIAAVNGFALGGGCELALACHIRIGSDNALLGLPEVGLGIIPGYGGTVRLPRLVGPGVALELICSGRHVKADEAVRIGLLNRVVPADQLMDEVMGLARKIAAAGPRAVGYALESWLRGRSMGAEEALHYESRLFGLVSGTRDMREGMRAFLEKRKPEFRDE